MANFHTDSFGSQREVRIQGKPSRSAMANWAFRCSALLFIIPLVPLVGLTLGWMALCSMKTNVLKIGRKRACAAMCLGFVFTAAQGFIGWQVWQYYQAAQNGPQSALVAGLSGDVSGFVEEFESQLAPIDTAQASNFLKLLQERYGDCDHATLVLPENWYMSWRPFEAFEYNLEFAHATVRATAQIVVKPDFTSLTWRPKLRYIEVHDSERGDIRFPATESASATASTASAFVDQP